MDTNSLQTVGEKVIASGGKRDILARRRLNTAVDTVSEITAKELQSGQVTIETIEKLTTPCYLYSTQLTLHGKLPEITCKKDALGYTSLIFNANKTIGVKYNAIDAVKKNEIAKKVGAWRETQKEGTVSNSTDFIVYRPYGQFTEANKEEYKIALAKAQEDLKALPLCFYGDARIMQTNCYGIVCLYLTCFVGAIHSENVDEIVSFFTGHTPEETDKKMEENAIKKEQDRKEAEAHWEQEKQKDLERKQKATEEFEKSLLDNPPTGYKGLGEYNYKVLVRQIDGQYLVKEGVVTYTEKGNSISIKYGKEKETQYPKEKFTKIIETTNKKLWKQEEEETLQETPKGDKPTVTHNTDKGGVEIRFNGMPSKAVLDSLKANGWRWSNFQKVWYTKYSQKALDFANQIVA